MLSHLRANLVLVGGTFLLCSIAYPSVVWVASFAFPSKAKGDIVTLDGKPVGSLLIAQNFTGNEYFQPRPSAASFNASFSSASNLGANSPKLRGRVAQQLGPIVTFSNGVPVGRKVEKWFHDNPNGLAVWAERYPTLAGVWLANDPLNKDFVIQWLKDYPEIVANWKKANPKADGEPKPEDIVVDFFTSYAALNPGAVPVIVETTKGETKEKSVQPVAVPLGVPGWFFDLFLQEEHSDIQAWFFDMWLQEHPEAELKPVPADMVTSSGSGLDPHITLRNAEYQLDRVATEWSNKKTLDKKKVEKDIEQLLHEKAFTPLLGYGGEPLVNVLEVNLALREKYGSTAK